MNRVYKFVTLAFFLIGVPRLAWCMIRDSRHPEWWGDISHNFALELALLGVFVAGVFLLLVVALLRMRKASSPAVP